MKFILGSGIIGMVLCFYMKDFMVLTKGKGQDGSRIGPKFIRENEYTKSFIDKINKKIKGSIFHSIMSHQICCAYNIKGELKKKISDRELKQYIIKSRGEEYIEKFKSSAMNDGLVDFKGYYMDEVYKALSSLKDFKTRRLFLNIKTITTKKHLIYGINPAVPEIELCLHYEHIFNTLPARVFNNLVGYEEKTSHNSEIIIFIIKSEEIFKSLGKNNFVYYIDKDIPYYRITKIGHNIVSIETKKMFFPRNIIKQKHRILNTIKIPYGKINDNVKPRDGINIHHMGRYAKNDNKLRVHNLIELFEKGEIEL